MKISNKTLTKIGITGVIIGLGIISISYFSAKRDYAYEFMYNELFSPNETSEETENVFKEEQTTKKEEKKETKKEEKKKKKEQTTGKTTSTKITDNYYIGKLEIPKIGFSRGFVSKTSKDNNVDKNITVLKESTMPDVKGGNLIIAGHSGTGPLAFFNDLYKLNKKDRIYVYYNNKKYAYKIVNIYKQKKTGKIKLYRNKKKTTLTLVTCTNNNKNTQTIYVAEQL